MTHVTRQCMNCNKNFAAPLKEIKRGNAKFCSISCSMKLRVRNTPKPDPNCRCHTCHKTFYRNIKKQKLAKHGYQFCSRKCKEIAQTMNNPHSLQEMMPPHYYNGVTSYRKKKLRSVEKLQCERCLYDDIPEILVVHHLDRDRENNHLDNLILLCPTCHEADHFLGKDGRYNTTKSGGPMKLRSSSITLQE